MASFPLGSITNMKMGSSIMLSTPPSMMPKLACMDLPSERIIWAKKEARQVGTAPIMTA